MLSVCQTVEMFKYMSQSIIDNEPLLTEIDSQIGDGDHGIGMSNGFLEVYKMLESREFNSVNEVFSEVGITILKTMGGASGVLFGTIFYCGNREALELQELNSVFFVEHFTKSLEAVKRRGRSDVGDKTMIDALDPAVKEMNELIDKDLHSVIEGASLGAEYGMNNTKKLRAQNGRARKFGDKSIGIQDAGATSVFILFRSMKEWMEKSNIEM